MGGLYMKKKKMNKFLAVTASSTLVVSSFGVSSIVLANQADVDSNVNLLETKVSKFTMYNDLASLAKYNESFKVDSAKITAENNGGSYNNSSLLKNILDGDINTYWETRTPNNTNFTNDITFTFDEVTELSRVIYAPRLVGAPGKGFPLEFEILGRTSTEEEFTKIAEGSYTSNVRDAIEIQFQSTNFKQLKFVFKNANQYYAAASEFMFYTEDQLANKMARLFTDNTLSQLSSEFNSVEALDKLEQEAKTHPFYGNLYKESIQNAKAILAQKVIAPVKAKMKAFNHYDNEEYRNQYMIPISNIKNITTNGRHYSSQVIGNAADGDLSTYWETNSWNTETFKNTVEVEFNEAVDINRLTYGARPDKKGFANTFDIYVSQTSNGDTYQLVSNGSYATVGGLVEAKFDTVKAKRVKFVFNTSNQNWATMSEISFFKEDAVYDEVENLFTDGTRSKVHADYSTIADLTALETKAQSHPLYTSELKELIDYAKLVIENKIDLERTVIKAEQVGNRTAIAKNNLRTNLGSSLQPTGLAALAGQTITVYVDAESSTQLPKLVFTQQEHSFNGWSSSYQLQPGKNVIKVPELPKNNWYRFDVTKGGLLYIDNPYTEETQGKAPVIRFEGVTKVPFMTLDTDPEVFKQELIEYQKLLEADAAKHENVLDRTLIDAVELVSDHMMYTGRASVAYKNYITNGLDPMDTLEGYDVWMHQIFDVHGLDGRSEKHDPSIIRESVRIMQPYGAAYAAGNHTGIQRGSWEDLMFADFRETYPGWGLNHEIGHRIDIDEREFTEVTNNMTSMKMSIIAGNMDNRIPYENSIYKNVIQENKVNWMQEDLFIRLGAFWQLELAQDGYWAKLESLFREKPVTTRSEEEKQQHLIKYSSDVFKQDLSEHFARHGFTVTEETKAYTAAYDKPTNKYWYLNNTVVGYTGEGLEADTPVNVNIVRNETNKTNTLNFAIAQDATSNLLGYEIYRDGQLVAFTSTSTYVDTNIDPDTNYEYKIVPFDKKLNELNAVTVKAFSPTIIADDYLTLKLRQDFNAKDYVSAQTYKGQDITESVNIISNNVDVTKKGNYQVVYEVTNAGITVTKIMNVSVTSNFEYASDLDEVAELSFTGWNGLRKNIAPQGTTITLLRGGKPVTFTKGLGAHANSEVVYNIEGKGYETFESYIGIDQAVKDSAYSSGKFEVWVDNELKYTSGTFNSNTNLGFVKVDVKDAKTIKLVTKDAGSHGITADHTVWADAKFTIGTSQPSITLSESFTTIQYQDYNFDLLNGVTAFDPEDGELEIKIEDNGFSPDKPGLYDITYTVTDSDGFTTTAKKQVYVYSDITYATEVDWKTATAAWGNVTKNKNLQDNGSIKLFVNGAKTEFQEGIGTHADSEIVYDLEGKDFDYFEALVGVEQSIPNTNRSSITFIIEGDGKELYNSGLMNYTTPAKTVKVSVKDVKQLKLIVEDNGNKDSDHAAWAEAKFLTSKAVQN